MYASCAGCVVAYTNSMSAGAPTSEMHDMGKIAVR
jgi:hypothetical protein